MLAPAPVVRAGPGGGGHGRCGRGGAAAGRRARESCGPETGGGARRVRVVGGEWREAVGVEHVFNRKRVERCPRLITKLHT